MNQPICIIEDDADDQDIIKSLCADLGICDNLAFFSNGNEALKFLKNPGVSPFLILCDINMPHLSGLQLRDEINRDPDLKKKSVPFIFFSTTASSQQVQQAYDMTVQGFFVKGNSFQETRETLDAIFKYWRLCKHPK